jgi:hypothetical protein
VPFSVHLLRRFRPVAFPRSTPLRTLTEVLAEALLVPFCTPTRGISDPLHFPVPCPYGPSQPRLQPQAESRLAHQTLTEVLAEALPCPFQMSSSTEASPTLCISPFCVPVCQPAFTIPSRSTHPQIHLPRYSPRPYHALSI